MTTEAGPLARLHAAMDEHPNATYVRVEVIDLRAGLAEARAALLAELEAGVEGLRDELAARGQPQRPQWYVRVLDLIRTQGTAKEPQTLADEP